jgi:hypothetical protein
MGFFSTMLCLPNHMSDRSWPLMRKPKCRWSRARRDPIVDEVLYATHLPPSFAKLHDDDRRYCRARPVARRRSGRFQSRVGGEAARGALSTAARPLAWAITPPVLQAGRGRARLRGSSCRQRQHRSGRRPRGRPHSAAARARPSGPGTGGFATRRGTRRGPGWRPGPGRLARARRAWRLSARQSPRPGKKNCSRVRKVWTDSSCMMTTKSSTAAGGVRIA